MLYKAYSEINNLQKAKAEYFMEAIRAWATVVQQSLMMQGHDFEGEVGYFSRIIEAELCRLRAEADLWREAAYGLAARNTENEHGVMHHYPNGYANERLAAADRHAEKAAE
jgi:hypothetical protein